MTQNCSVATKLMTSIWWGSLWCFLFSNPNISLALGLTTWKKPNCAVPASLCKTRRNNILTSEELSKDCYSRPSKLGILRQEVGFTSEMCGAKRRSGDLETSTQSL